MSARVTVGEQSLNAQRDNTKYDPDEIGHSLCDDILPEVWKCIDAHYDLIDDPEFCVVMVIATDCLILGVTRRKFYAWPYLPNPRPNQVVFHYDKFTNTIARLWSLPNPKVMAIVSEMKYVAPQWKDTKRWCDTFFSGIFHDSIRTWNNIGLESESEYLSAHTEELIQAGCKKLDSTFTKPFDFSKISVNQIVDSKAAFLGQATLDDFRQTEAADGNV